MYHTSKSGFNMDLLDILVSQLFCIILFQTKNTLKHLRNLIFFVSWYVFFPQSISVGSSLLIERHSQLTRHNVLLKQRNPTTLLMERWVTAVPLCEHDVFHHYYGRTLLFCDLVDFRLKRKMLPLEHHQAFSD